MFVITSKGSSWHQEDVIMSRSVSWRQKFCYNVKNTPNVCHEVKNTSWCQKVGHDFKKSWRHDKNTSWHQKVCYDVKNMSWRHKVCYTSKTRRDVKIVAPILHFYDVFSTNLVTLTLDLLNNINHWHKNTQLELFLTLLSCNYDSTISIKTNRSTTWTLPMMSPALTSWKIDYAETTKLGDWLVFSLGLLMFRLVDS